MVKFSQIFVIWILSIAVPSTPVTKFLSLEKAIAQDEASGADILGCIGGGLLVILIWGWIASANEPSHTPTFTLPSFFICNTMRDENQNGVWEENEFIIVLNEWSGNDRMIFVGRFYDKLGATASVRVKSPAGKECLTGEWLIDIKNAVCFLPSGAALLRAEGGVGEWSVTWYLDNREVAKLYFTLQR